MSRFVSDNFIIFFGKIIGEIFAKILAKIQRILQELLISGGLRSARGRLRRKLRHKPGVSIDFAHRLWELAQTRFAQT
jgi:hypothetical protein